MIKGILEKLIRQKLGMFIKNLTTQQLKTDLFGGEVTLTNVQLNQDFFNQKLQDTLLQLNYSSIGRLFIQAPLTKLSTVPVTLLIDDVYILLSTKNFQKLMQSEAKQSSNARETLLVSYIKKLFQKMMQNLKEKQDQGYLSKIMNRVIDNLTIKISNVHLRIQHASNDFTKSYSTGITIEEVSLRTADQNWKVNFIDRYEESQKSQQQQKDSKLQKVRKLVNVTAFNWYWESFKDDSRIITSKNESKSKYELMKYICEQARRKSPISPKVQLISLTSQSKILINPQKDLKNPLIQLSLNLQPITINVQQECLAQIIQFSNNLSQKYTRQSPQSSIQQQRKNLLTQFQNLNHKKLLQKITQEIVSKIDPEKQTLNFEDNFIQKFNSSKEITSLVDNYQLQFLLKQAQSLVKTQVIKIKEKKLKKQTKGWFSKERQLTEKEKQQLQQLVENTFLQTSVKRPKGAPFIRANLFIEKLQIRVLNKHCQNIIFTMNELSFSLTLSKDMKSCYLNSALTSVELYYLSSQSVKTILVKNFGVKGSKKLIELELRLLEKQNIKLTKIRAEIAKILVNYEHFLIKKITDFVGSVSKGKTENLNKLIEQKSSRNKLSSPKKQTLPEFEYIFEVNVQLSSPTILLPVEQAEYVDSGHNSLIKLQTKQCWVLDLGCLAVKNQKNTSTHLVELKDISLKHCKTFNLEGDSVEEKQFTYSFINGMDVLGSVHISDKNQLDLKLRFQKVQLSVSYTEYKKILKIVQLLMQFIVQKNNSEMDQIILNSVWQGSIKKKQYKIQSGYVYVDYFAILNPEKLYLYQKQGDLKYKQYLHLKQYQLKAKQSKQKDKHISQISQKSSQISEGIGFYSKIQLETQNKQYTFKVSNQTLHQFEQNLLPLLAQRQNLNRLQEIVEEVDENIAPSNDEDQDVFEDFDDAEGENEAIETSLRKNVQNQSEQMIEKGASSIFSKMKLSVYLQRIILRYEQDHTDQKCSIKSYNKASYLYELWITEINTQVIHCSNKKQTNIKFSINNVHLTDYVYNYRNKTIQSLFILDDFSLNATHIHSIQQNLDLLGSVDIIHNVDQENLFQTNKEQIIVDLKLAKVIINWKPDVFLAIIHFFNSTKQQVNSGSVISPQITQKIISKRAINQINIDNFITQNPEFWQKKTLYDEQYKQKIYQKNQLFKPMQNVRLSIDSTITQIQINFMHRQSHLRVFKVIGNKIQAKIGINRDTLSSQILIADLKIIDTTNYPQKQYIQAQQHLNKEFILFGKKQGYQGLNFIQIKFIKHQNQLSVCNSRRINSAICIQVEPAFFFYFQQPILRIIDYSLVQILTLLTDYHLIQANESLKAQISQLRDTNIQKQREKLQKEAVFVVFKEYEELLKKLIHPLFSDMTILMKKPQIILKAIKNENFSVLLQCETVTVQNSQRKAPNRANFQNVNKESVKNIETYEQVFTVNLQNTLLSLKQNSSNSKFQYQFSNVIQGTFVFDKLLYQNELQKLYPSVKLIRDLNCQLQFLPELRIPQLSRATYQNLLKITNFNLSFDDGQDDMFIHNYQISKLRDPSLINFNFTVPKISLSCCYDDPNDKKEKVELLTLKIENFVLGFHRDKILDSEVKVNFKSLQIDYPKHKRSQQNLNLINQDNLILLKRNTLVSYPFDQQGRQQRKKDIVYIHMSKRDSSKAILVFLKNLTLFIDMKIINAAQQFFNVQKWVYPVQRDTNSPLSFHCELQNAQIYIPQTNSQNSEEGFLIKGIVYFQYKILETLTFESVQKMFNDKILDQKDLKDIGEFTNMNVKMWINFFYYRREQNQPRENQLQRRILELTEISFSNSLTYDYVLSEKKSDISKKQDWSERAIMIASSIRINTSALRIKISFSDYILLESIMKEFSAQKNQAEQIIKCFNKINDKNAAFYNQDKSIDQIQFEKPRGSPFSQLSMEFGGASCLVYDLKFNPIVQVKMSDFNLFKKSNSVAAQMEFEGKYFNDDIFAWQPFLEENKILFIYQETNPLIQQEDDSRSNQYIQFNLQKEVRINFSRELMKSLLNLMSAYNKYSKQQKTSKSSGSMSKIQSQITPSVQNTKQIEFISHYVIRNQTGYPIKIFSSRGKEVTIMMNHTSLPYTFDEKYSRSSEIITDTIGVQILHEKYWLQTIYGVSFLMKKKIKVKLKTMQNKFLSDTITLDSYCKDCKKILLIASPKYVKDYSWNNLIETYLPFDHPNNVELTVPQKVKVSLFDNNVNRNIKSEYFYRADNGCLEIKYPKTVYNYTPIPLEVSGAFALPGKFVGIQQPLHIQGIFHQQQSMIKVIHNKEKREYYLYSAAYLIDYTGTLEYAFKNPLILKRFMYETLQNKRKITIYLLPDVSQNFSVRWQKEKFIDVDAKLGRQTVQLRKGLEIHQFNVFSYLSSIQNSQIKQLKKIIEVTESIYLVNETQYDVMLPQNNYRNEVIYLKKGQKKPFYWQDFACPKQFQVVPEIPEFGSSCMLGLQNSESFLIPHSSKDYRKGKIFSLVCQNTDNIDFVVIQQCSQSRYKLTNFVQNSVMSLYLKQNSKEKIVELFYGESLPFAFINNEMRSEFWVEITLDAHLPGQGYVSEKIKIERFEGILFQKQICLRPNSARSAPLKWLCLQLTFENKKKRLKLGASKPKIQKNKKQHKEVQVLLKIPKLFISLIGNYEYVRKQIFVFILEQIGLEIIKTKKAITYSVLLQGLRIENLYKHSPYYEVIAYSQLTTSKCFMKFVYSQSLDSPNLIYYLGFSMGHLVLTLTSQQLQIFLNNVNDLMQDKYLLESQEHDFVHITYQQKVNPAHLARPNDFIYFVGAEIRPFKATVTFKNVSGWGGIIGKAFGNINQCKLQIDGKVIKNMLFPNFHTFLSVVQTHFVDSIKGELFSIVGSLTLISAPLSVASKIKTGFENFLTLPAESFDGNPLDLGKGVALGTGSLIKNTFQGIFEGAQSLTALIGNGLSMAITDEEFNRKRTEIKNKKSSNIAQGIGHGVVSIFNGISQGITGIITEPAKGASKKGFGGFGLGILKGVTGLVTKPITGIVDGVSKTAQGIKNTTKIFESEQNGMKQKKSYLNRPFYGQQRSIKAYDKDLAYWNSFLQKEHDEQIHQSFVYVNIYKAKSRHSNMIIIITPIYTFLMDRQRNQIIETIRNQNIRKLDIDKKESKKVLMAAEIYQNIQTIQLTMSNEEEAKEIVKDIQVYSKPSESTIYYRKDQ